LKRYGNGKTAAQIAVSVFRTVVTSQASRVSQAGTAAAAVSASSPQPAGGVLGVTATMKKSGKPAGGVAGALASAGNVAGANLPFTGFPIWAAVLIALGLIALGLTLRRRARATV
jgi:hypothetical protein